MKKVIVTPSRWIRGVPWAAAQPRPGFAWSSRGIGRQVAEPDQVVGRVSLWVAFLFKFCILASILLGMMGFFPIRYMQPVSALYIVPFFVYVGARHARDGRAGSLFMSLWAALYALHAILLVAGAPIHFGRLDEALNVLIPLVGYGLIAALAAHIYSRFALRRLRALATSPETPDQSI